MTKTDRTGPCCKPCTSLYCYFAADCQANPVIVSVKKRFTLKIFSVGTPFGSMSRDVFLNCLSTGVVSNVTGNQKELFLTDARCIPGSEGGAVWTIQNDR